MMDLMLEIGFLGLKLLRYVLGFKQVLFSSFWSFFEIFEDLLHSIKIIKYAKKLTKNEENIRICKKIILKSRIFT